MLDQSDKSWLLNQFSDIENLINSNSYRPYYYYWNDLADKDYWVFGVLGLLIALVAILLILVIALTSRMKKLQNHMQEAERKREAEKELNARFAVYNAGDLHRNQPVPFSGVGLGQSLGNPPQMNDRQTRRF